MTLPLRRRYWLPPLIAAGLAGAFAVGSWYGERRVRTMNEWADAQLLSTAIDSVRANALDSLPSDELIRRAVAGMLRELHDPYAALLQPSGVEKHRNTMVGEGQGLGLTLRREPDAAAVVRVAVGSPAFSAGIRPGDRILMVDSVPVSRAWGDKKTDKLRDVSRDTTRAADETSVLTLWRAPFGDTLHLTVKRATWHMAAITEQGLLSDSVGYVRLASITSHSADELEDAVASLLQRGATSLVLDLRGNTGGLFEEGVKAAGLFLPRGAVVASLAGRGGEAAQPHSSKNSRWPTLPLTLLVDGNTASSAEVIAAALRDYDRALLVGTTTYGKGVVQRVVRLSKELSLRLTTARWLTPKGVSLVRREGNGAAAVGGLRPDVMLEDAARRDQYAVPREWTEQSATLAMRAADSLAMFALREGWSTTPLAVLEARVRATLAQATPLKRAAGKSKSKQSRDALAREAVARAEWVTVSTRLTLVRILEVEREHEALLRYAARDDEALRAGVDILAPGTEISRVLPSVLPAVISRRSLALTLPHP